MSWSTPPSASICLNVAACEVVFVNNQWYFVLHGAPPFKPEHGFEFNTLLDVVPMVRLQRLFNIA
jgi:hypothetical protein